MSHTDDTEGFDLGPRRHPRRMSLTPMIAQMLADHGGLGYVGLYLAAAGVISFVAMVPLKRTAEG